MTSLDSFLPVPSLPSIVATLVHMPTVVSLWLQVKVVEAPGASSLAPPAMPSQFSSLKFDSLSVTSPVFRTMISYLTVSPMAPVSSFLVKAPPPICWSFSIVKPGPAERPGL